MALPLVQSEHSCLPNQYRCSNGRCISSIWKCDSDNDCGDMSDEQECRKPRAAASQPLCAAFDRRPLRPSATTTCDPSNQFRCAASGSCVPLAFKCDREDDCGDNSDEEHCGNTPIPRGWLAHNLCGPGAEPWGTPLQI